MRGNLVTMDAEAPAGGRGIEDVTRVILEEAAAAGATITYAELAAALTEAGHAIEPGDPSLGAMLGRISVDDDARGRGMLSAVVVRRDGGRPGGGFFRLAEQLGRDVADRDVCWTAELARVVAHHRGRGAVAGGGSDLR